MRGESQGCSCLRVFGTNRRSNPTWGAPRIVGELRKIGIDVAKSTVEKYRPRTRKPSSPTWKAFLNNHVKDIVACDFFTGSCWIPGSWI
jgi:hypothetical protein